MSHCHHIVATRVATHWTEDNGWPWVAICTIYQPINAEMGTTTPPNLLLPTSVPCSSTTTCGCFTVLLIIINYMAPRGDRVCPNLGCNASVALRVRLGTKNPENRGHWYEAVCPILLFLKPKLTATKFKCTASAWNSGLVPVFRHNWLQPELNRLFYFKLWSEPQPEPG
jgi:hypothetical protein